MQYVNRREENEQHILDKTSNAWLPTVGVRRGMVGGLPVLLQLHTGHLLLLLIFEIPNGVDHAGVSRWYGVHLRKFLIVAFGRFQFAVAVALAIGRMNVGAVASVAYELRVLAETRHRLGLHAAPMVRAIAQTTLIKRKTRNVITLNGRRNPFDDAQRSTSSNEYS
jgi:hypothetical protein